MTDENKINEAKANKIVVDGVVAENLPNARFKIRIADPRFPENFIVDGYIAGKMRMHFIKIIPGDKVKIELDLQDLHIGRIVFRSK